MRLGREEATNACVQLGLRLIEDLWDTENLLQSDSKRSRDPVSHSENENERPEREVGRKEAKERVTAS